MFSRFLRTFTTKLHEETLKNSSCNFQIDSRFHIFFIALLFLPLFAACSVSEPPIATKQHFEKQYIEPPEQQKIPASKTALKVCADPNNLPFSNEKQEGFENKIADLIAKEMNVPVEYTWWAQRRGFFRNTLRAGVCDVVIGVPSSFELAATTLPYYRSTYVFVSRQDRKIDIKSLDDPALKELKIGVQMIGDDFTNTPPAHALANRGIIKNLVGYTVYGDYKQPNPPARILDAVAKGDVDMAIVWGPLAGYFAKKEKIPFRIEPVSPQIDLPYLPFVYDISMGVRRGEDELKAQLEDIIRRKHSEIEAILDEYNIPRVSTETAALNKEGR
jgi:mxaJ protein